MLPCPPLCGCSYTPKRDRQADRIPEHSLLGTGCFQHSLTVSRTLQKIQERKALKLFERTIGQDTQQAIFESAN